MGTCYVCPSGDNYVADEDFLDHLRLFHPDVFGDGPERWPDGRAVVDDRTLEPEDFERSGGG